MAKIGNETKLVLKLASELVDRDKSDLLKTGQWHGKECDKAWIYGFITARVHYDSILQGIVADLEQK